jgi:hypothetical protein
MRRQPTVAIITSVTDGYDTLKRTRQQFGVDVEWIAVTDGKEVREEDHGWTIFPFVPEDTSGSGLRASTADETHPNRLAKIAKCMPWTVSLAEYTIWIDASYRVISPLFAKEAIEFAHPIAQFVHPWRGCLYDEGDASMALPRYEDQSVMIAEQMAEYREIGHPRDWGLWATGVIVRKNIADLHVFGEQWLAEIRRWSFQDQVSEPMALRMCDLRPSPLPGDHIRNPWLGYEGSARHG